MEAPYSSVSSESHSITIGSGSGICNELTPSAPFPEFTSNVNYNDYDRLRTKEETQIDPSIMSRLQNQVNASETRHKTKVTSAEWKFMLAGVCLEVLCIAFDQVASPTKGGYALLGLFFAFAALVLSLWELIHQYRKERAKSRRVGVRRFHDHRRSKNPRSFYAVLGSSSIIYGLVFGITQCICSIVQCVFFLRHGDNPIKASLSPAVFLICMAIKKFICPYAGE